MSVIHIIIGMFNSNPRIPQYLNNRQKGNEPMLYIQELQFFRSSRALNLCNHDFSQPMITGPQHCSVSLPFDGVVLKDISEAVTKSRGDGQVHYFLKMPDLS